MGENSKVFSARLMLAAAGLAALTGCDSLDYLFGGSRPTPDEFRVLARAPLEVPPDFNLRPPQPGSPRPQEIVKETRATSTVFGAATTEATAVASATANQSKGEAALVAKAGADQADPQIRKIVDKEWPGVVVGDRSFLDSLMFWKGDSAPKDNAPVLNRDSSSAGAR
ncbi:DUF3035 domain-containing protein [Nitrospirillum iridis]|uniref:Beta-barrel assembly machine subunit BamF n=1 Tax=Nitrospirillum iridis TaxID=765888 RepID=A0A7X0B2R2_9PROT|nr:DUF3035 domain-containing protein [Nitrospirillum iridis]MBB6254674.1 hypothetical protein [Nitrospirillum iridis]